MIGISGQKKPKPANAQIRISVALITPEIAPWVAIARARRDFTCRAPNSAAWRPIGIARPSHTHFGQNDPPPVAAQSNVTAIARMPDTVAWTASRW